MNQLKKINKRYLDLSLYTPYKIIKGFASDNLTKCSVRYCTTCDVLQPYQFELKNEVISGIPSLDTSDIICLECLEVLLGRKLTIDDFTLNYINYPIFFGALLSSPQCEQSVEQESIPQPTMCNTISDEVVIDVTESHVIHNGIDLIKADTIEPEYDSSPDASNMNSEDTNNEYT